MKTAGYDFLFIDMEHNSMSIDLAAQICVAGQDAGITPVVRVPDFQHFHATRALDAGAQGIVVPHVDTPDVAARMVQYCMYPPIGHRSVTGRCRSSTRPAPLGEATAAINAATLLILMLETPEAIGNVEEIAAVPGFDVLLVGTNDLCMEMGIPGQLDHPRISEAFERVIGVPGARQARRARRRVRSAADAALSGDGLSPGARRQRPHLYAHGRQGARRRRPRDELRVGKRKSRAVHAA